MKGIKQTSKFGNNKGTQYSFLLIENLEDLAKYGNIYLNVTSSKNVDAWFGFSSQDFRKSFNDYIIHEGSNVPATTRAVGMKMAYKDTPTNVVEFCKISDELMSNKLNSMQTFIEKGFTIRVNKHGGYCPLTEKMDELGSGINHIDEEFEVSDKEILNFINKGKFTVKELEITSKSVIIENYHTVPNGFLDLLPEKIKSNSQHLTEFKLYTAVSSDEEILKTFQKGIDNGLENICFQTTGQDLYNLNKMKTLLVKLLDLNKNKRLNLYVSTHDKKTIELFSNIPRVNTKIIKY